MDKFSLIIFDLDGTLVDSRRDIATSVNHAIQAVVGNPVPEEQVFPYIGEGLARTFRELTGEKDPALLARMEEEYKSHFFDHCDVHSKVYPGVLETLAKLTGFQKALATTKRTFMARRVAGVMGFLEYMDHIQGSDDIALKPDPAGPASSRNILFFSQS